MCVVNKSRVLDIGAVVCKLSLEPSTSTQFVSFLYFFLFVALASACRDEEQVLGVVKMNVVETNIGAGVLMGNLFAALAY